VEPLREYAFTDADFSRIRSLVTMHAGISMGESKRELVYCRLSRRLRQLGISSFDRYCSIVEAGDSTEVPQFVNAITTNLTAFFREQHHFECLADKVLPELMARKTSARKLRIWSAGCSTGEEPYSIAIVVRDFFKNRRGWDIKILATDIDSNVLDAAQKGIYREDGTRRMPPHVLQSSFQKGMGANDSFVKVAAELKEMISFRQLNLMDGWPMRNPFDVIFCRNVVIYFSKPNQKILFDRFANALDSRGFLFVGHSESLFNVSNRFELIGKTVYSRRD
jgi:chemotaxis protein methyltransferase CheR